MNSRWRRFGAKLVAVALAVGVLCVCSPAFAGKKEEKQLEQLEKQLQAIKASLAEGATEEARIEQLEKEIAELKEAMAKGASGGGTRGLTDQQLETVHE